MQRFFREKQGDVAVYYDLAPHERTDSRGIIGVDPATLRVSSFYEKPAEGVTASRAASVRLLQPSALGVEINHASP